MYSYNSISSDFDLEVDGSCGTHVHISREDGWTLMGLWNLAISILKLEVQMDNFLPERSNNLFCKSNSASASLELLTAHERIIHLSLCKSNAAVVVAMSAGIKPPDDEDSEDSAEY